MSYLKIDATGENVIVELNEDTGGVDVTIGPLSRPITFKRDEAKTLAAALMAEIDAPLPRMAFSAGAIDIGAERLRQITSEGFSAEHDAEHDDGELLEGAMAYAADARRTRTGAAPGTDSDGAENDWPFETAGFKPTSYRATLVKAGAMIAAEIDRTDRI